MLNKDNNTKKIKNPNKNKALIRYRCKVCGYVYENNIKKEPFICICPVCKNKATFEKTMLT